MKVSIPDCFLIAFAAGMVFGLVYEALRIVRLILRGKYIVFACDMAFFALAAMSVCGLSEFLGNYVRIYTVLGFGAGIFAYIVTLGRLFNLFESALAKALRRFFGRLFVKLKNVFKKFIVQIKQKLKAASGIIDNYFTKILKKRSEHLKSSGKMVYNNTGIINAEKGEDKNVIRARVTKNP